MTSLLLLKLWDNEIEQIIFGTVSLIVISWVFTRIYAAIEHVKDAPVRKEAVKRHIDAQNEFERENIDLINSKGKAGALAQLESEAARLKDTLDDWRNYGYDEFGQWLSDEEKVEARPGYEAKLKKLTTRIEFVKSRSK